MDPACEELERRSRYLSALVRRTKLADPPQPQPEAKADVEPPQLKAPPHVGGEGKGGKDEAKAEERTAMKKPRGEAAAEGRKVAVCVRAADMPLPLQRRAVRIALEAVAAMPRLESKRLALALKKVPITVGTKLLPLVYFSR
jgi:dynein light chain LC8-type